MDNQRYNNMYFCAFKNNLYGTGLYTHCNEMIGWVYFYFHETPNNTRTKLRKKNHYRLVITHTRHIILIFLFAVFLFVDFFSKKQNIQRGEFSQIFKSTHLIWGVIRKWCVLKSLFLWFYLFYNNEVLNYD